MNKAILSTMIAITTLGGITTASTAHADGTTPPPWDFYDVPQLGTEPVRGSGCSGDGSIAEIVPDGYWFGYMPSENNSTIEFDLACLYIEEQPNSWEYAGGWMLNNRTLTRTVPKATTFVLAEAQYDDDHSAPLASAEPASAIPNDVRYAATEAWLYVKDGRAQWVVWAPYVPSNYGSFLEYTWNRLPALDQQRLCNDVAYSETLGVPEWLNESLPDTELDETIVNDMVDGFCPNVAEPVATPQYVGSMPPTIVLEASGELFWTDPAFSQEPYGQTVYQDESGAWYFLTDDGSYYLTDEDVWGTGDVDGDRINDLADPDDSDGPTYDDCGC